eukprot:5195172-Pyramimonas_sp.AAC.1
MDNPTEHKAPELIVRPACFQAFLEVARAIEGAGDKVGMDNKTAWLEVCRGVEQARSHAHR